MQLLSDVSALCTSLHANSRPQTFKWITDKSSLAKCSDYSYMRSLVSIMVRQQIAVDMISFLKHWDEIFDTKVMHCNGLQQYLFTSNGQKKSIENIRGNIRKCSTWSPIRNWRTLKEPFPTMFLSNTKKSSFNVLYVLDFRLFGFSGKRKPQKNLCKTPIIECFLFLKKKFQLESHKNFKTLKESFSTICYPALKRIHELVPLIQTLFENFPF